MSTTGTGRTIPFLDLSRQHKELEVEITAAIGNVFSRGDFVLGAEVSAFEAEWANYCGTSDCSSVACGTDAISLALQAACNISPGDEVITSALTAGYTALAIMQCGAIPVFADVDPATLLIDASSVERSITSRTKAIVPVHLYGQLCDLEALAAIARRHDLAMIEDAAQAHGAWRNEKLAGAPSRTAAFSFYPTKNLGACGDGGAIVSDDPELIERVKILRQGGHPSAMSQKIGGRNSRLDEIQAAILRVKLKHLDRWNRQRERFADMYDGLLAQSTSMIPVARRADHSNHLYVIRTKRRDELSVFLDERRISTMVHYPRPLHRLELFSQGRRSPELPAVDAAAAEVLSLPMNSHCEDWEIESTVNSIIEFDRFGI